MDWTSILLALINNAMKPFIYCLTIFFIILRFKNEIIKFIGTFTKISSKFKTIECKYFRIDLEGELQKIQTYNYSALQKEIQNPLLIKEEEIISKKLIEANLTEEQSINELIKQVAYSRLLTRLVVIDVASLYPEQIELLIYLNNATSEIPEKNLFMFHKRWLEKYSQEKIDPSFEGFMNRLYENQLIERHVHGWYITLLGREYLCFLTRTYRAPWLRVFEDKNDT